MTTREPLRRASLNPSTAPLVFKPLSIRLVCAGVWTIFLLGIWDDGLRDTSIGWLVLAFIPVAIWRSLHMALIADSAGITVRNWWFTRRLARKEVAAITWRESVLPARGATDRLCVEPKHGLRVTTWMAGAGSTPSRKPPLADLERLALSHGVAWYAPSASSPQADP